MYDYLSIADGKAVPYGMYDLVHDSGFVNVGIDHETAEFAVESIRRWWQSIGRNLYPASQELFIVADGGGSNGVRNRLWKQQLQLLANETGFAITVCHLPPATKILWIVDYPRASGPLQIDETNLSNPGKTFHQTIAGEGEIPSIVVVPSAGCWRLQIISGNANGTLILWVVG